MPSPETLWRSYPVTDVGSQSQEIFRYLLAYQDDSRTNCLSTKHFLGFKYAYSTYLSGLNDVVLVSNECNNTIQLFRSFCSPHNPQRVEVAHKPTGRRMRGYGPVIVGDPFSFLVPSA